MSGKGEHPYRELGDDVRRRIQRLLDEIEPLHARIAEPYWQRLGGSLRDRLGQLCNSDDDAREPDLEVYRDELRDAVRSAPQVERWLTALPNTIAELALGEPWLSEDSVVLLAREWTGGAGARHRSLQARVARWVGGHDSSAKILQHQSGDVRVAPFQVHGSPFALQARPVGYEEDAEFTLVTPTARAMSPMTVEEKHWAHILGEWLLLHRDAETGDDLFDEHFFVDADVEAARRLLDREIRRALADFAHSSPPTLTLRDGFARLSWRYVPLGEMLDRAASILTALRHANLDIQLLV